MLSLLICSSFISWERRWMFDQELRAAAETKLKITRCYHLKWDWRNGKLILVCFCCRGCCFFFTKLIKLSVRWVMWLTESNLRPWAVFTCHCQKYKMYLILSLSSYRIGICLWGSIWYSCYGNEFICLPAKIKKEGKPAIFIIKVNTPAFEKIINLTWKWS